MQELFIEGNALFGRFKETILIEEFNYLESSLFYPDKSIYDKIAFYSVFGGSPFVNEMIDPSESLKDNIINTFLKVGSGVYNYANNILFTDTANRLQAKRIVSALGNSKKRYSELESLLDIEKTGKINAALKSLCELGVVGKIYPINKLDDSKKAYYEITDNALRFFHTYVNKSNSILTVLGAEAFYDEYVAPSLQTFIDHQFENVVRTFFSLKVKKGLIKGISNIGTYYYDDSKTKTNGEFAVALKQSDGYAIYEVKYYKDVVKKETFAKELEQISNIQEINVTNIGFVSVYGFEENDEKYDYVDGKSIYDETLL